MLKINDHGIETVEDLLWVFPPYSLFIDSENHLHRAIWLAQKYDASTPFIELYFKDNQKDDFVIYIRMIQNEEYKRQQSAEIDSLAAEFFYWHKENYPKNMYTVETVKPATLAWLATDNSTEP